MKRLLFFLSLAALSINAQAAIIYCSSSGGGSGANFSNLATLPSGSGFSRANTYVIVDDTYAGRDFSTAASGSTVILIRKASTADSGVTGYSTTLHDGTADFTADLRIMSPYWKIDGVTGGGPGSWTTGHGIRILNGIFYVNPDFAANMSGFTIEHVAFTGDAGSYINNGCIGANQANDGLVRYCFFDQLAAAACLGMNSGTFNNWTFEFNYFDRFCKYCSAAEHGEVGTFQFGGQSNFTFRWNIVTDCGSIGAGTTGGLLTSGRFWYIYGNVFYRPAGETWNYGGDGFIGPHINKGWVFQDSFLYNNTFINVPSSAIGPSGGNTTGNNNVRNNYFYNTGTGLPNGIYNHDYNHYQDSGTEQEANGTQGSGFPFISLVPDNAQFAMVTSPVQGDLSVPSQYRTDWWGTINTHVGAVYSGTPPEPLPPDILTGNLTFTNGIAVNYQVIVTNGATSYGATNLPSGLVIGGASGVISGTPSALQTNTVGLFVTNSVGTDVAVITVTIIPPPPILSVSVASLDFSFIATNTTRDLTLVVSNAEPSGSVLSGSLSNVLGAFANQTTPPTYSLSGTQSKTYTIRYAPTAVATNLGSLVVNGNGGSNFITLSGAAYPNFTGTNWTMTAALVVAPMASNQNNYISSTPNGFNGGVAVWGYNQAAQTTGTFWGTLVATNLTGGASISFHNVSSEHVDNAASGRSTAHTLNTTLTNGYVLAIVGTWDLSDAQVQGGTFDGTSMTLLVQTNVDYFGEYWVKIFGVATGNKAAGSYNFIMSSTDSIDSYNVGILSYADVDGVRGVAANQAASSTASLAISSATGDVVVGGALKEGVTGAPQSGETERFDTTPGSNVDILWGGDEPGASSVTFGATLSASAQWAMAAVSLRPGTNTGVNSFVFGLNQYPPNGTNQWPIIPKATNWGVGYVHIKGTGTTEAPQFPTNQFILGTSNVFWLAGVDNNTKLRELNYSSAAVGADTTAPVVTITAPTNGTIIQVITQPLTTLAGTASDNVGVSSVVATNTTTGVQIVLTGTTTWSAASATLQAGTNVITVYATDAVPNTGTDTVTVIYQPPAVSTALELRVTNELIIR